MNPTGDLPFYQRQRPNVDPHYAHYHYHYVAHQMVPYTLVTVWEVVLLRLFVWKRVGT